MVPAGTRDAMALVLALAIALTLASPARAARDLRVEDAVRIARAHHPTVETQRAVAATAGARVAQAAAGFLPFLTGNFAFEPQTANLVLTPSLRQVTTRGNDTVVDSSGRPVSVVCSTPGQAGCVPTPPAPSSLALQSYFTAGVGVAWTPWDWGRSAYAYRGARAIAEAAETGVTTAERDVALGARLAFFRAIAAGDQVAVAEESVATYGKQLDQTRAFYAAGLRTKIDVATAESGLAAAQLTLARAQALRETARSALAVALGEDASSGGWGDWHLVPDPAAFDIQPADQTRAATPEPTLTETAMRRRTEIAELGLLARGYADQARSQRGQYLPQLTLGATPTWAGQDISALTGNMIFTVSLGYAGGMSPFLIRGQVREAEGNLAATHARERATRDGIRQETSDARALLAAAGEEVRAARALVAAAAAQRELAAGRYATGVGTIIELQNALLNDVSARFQRVQAGYDLAAARAQLQHALGEDD